MHRSYLFVPVEAVFQDDGHDCVWLLDNDLRVVKRRIEVANSQSGTTRVESGLKLEDKVILRPPKGLRDGDVVRESTR